MIGQNKFDSNQILNLYFLLMKKYEETKFANDGKHKIIFLQINTLLEVYYDKVIKDKLHLIDKCKLEMLFKDNILNTNLELYLQIDQKEIEENNNEDNVVSIMEDISNESLEQERCVSSQELYELLEENSIIEIVNVKKCIPNSKETKDINQISLSFDKNKVEVIPKNRNQHLQNSPFDKVLTKVNEEIPRSEENIIVNNNIENQSKENSLSGIDIENNNFIHVQSEKIKTKKKWRNLPQRYKYPFYTKIEKENLSKNFYISSPSTKLLTQTQLENIVQSLQNVSLQYNDQDLTVNSNSFEQIDIMLSENVNNTSLTNNEIDLNLPRQLTQSRNQNFSQIRTIENIISSNSNTKFLQNTNSLNLDFPTAMNKYSDDIFLDLPSNIAADLENPLAIDDTAQQNKNTNELGRESLVISMQHLNASIQLPNLESNNQLSPTKIMNSNTESSLKPRVYIPTKNFYSIRTPNLKPPETYQNWLNYFENNNRPIYYESPEKPKPKTRKKKFNNENNQYNIPNIKNQLNPVESIDTYQELKRFDNEIIDSHNEFKTQFKNFKKIFLDSSPVKFCKLTKFEKKFFHSIQLQDVFEVFNDCSSIAKAVVLNNSTQYENNSKIRRLSDNEIIELFNQADLDISKIGLDIRTHLFNLKHKSKFFGSIFKNLDIYKISKKN